MKKLVFLIFTSFFVALIIFIIYKSIQEKNRFVSPIPEEKGIKVIIVTPAK